MDCPKCGARNTRRAAFCQACGTPLTATAAESQANDDTIASSARKTTRRTARPAPPTDTTEAVVADEGAAETWASARRPIGGGARQWSFNPERLFVGDWYGALAMSLLALVAMAALAAASMGIAGYDAGAGAWFKRMLAYVALSVGGSARLPLDQPLGHVTPSISVMPLTFTLVGFGLLGWLTARRLKQAPHTAVDFVLQAIRTIIAMVLLLVVVGFVARHGHSDSADYVHVKVAYTAFFGGCVTLATLGVTYFVAFGATLPGAARIWRDRLVGPAVGIFVLVATSLVLATVYALVQILAVPHHLSQMSQTALMLDAGLGRREELASLLQRAPNHALWMLMWSMGVPLTVVLGHQSRSLTLTTFTDGDKGFFQEPGNGLYWLLLPIAAVLWLKAAAVAALHAATPGEGRRNGYRMLLLIPLLTSTIFVMAGVAERQGQFLLRLHFAYWWAFLLGLVWAAGASILAPELVLRLPASVISGLRRVLVRFFRALPSAAPDATAATVGDSASGGSVD